MKLSTKGRYAVTALADIALQGAEPGGDEARLVSLAEIAERQDISLAYLEQLFARLRRAGLVESMRGPGGGYRLARPATQINIAQIMAAVDERLNAMGCDKKPGQGCGGSKAGCLTHNLWEQLSAHVHVFLARMTLADVVADRLAPCPAVPDFAALIEDDAEDSAAAANAP
ncbi:Rrf2 family transcriptional regulator [Oceanicella actignis]|uniref:Rrf2 family transcriptional regulator n=1 Tax=Oceanicella actignis TaxID=1189325 RepID=UPI0011E810E9|nr:Rrf2 family transcriptional regulator [Oceanicella actignis]TYO88492.1 BadM/Rrf2 family transcriptional regulator [Oceanicella actignis]